MENHRGKFEIPEEGMDTPGGYLYYPPKQSKQILFLVASFFTAIFLGWMISSIPGDLSDLASGVIYFVYLMVLILGYSVWVSWISALLFDTIKLPLIKIIFGFIFRRKKPDSIEELLPTREKAVELMVRAQKAAKIYFILSWPIGILGGFFTMFMDTSTSASFLFIIVLSSAVLFGYVLYYFGRRGYFPFPEE
ncbi:MAG: hypothetical protein R6W90_17360 [Ignavibacteriaceae bacterium]